MTIQKNNWKQLWSERSAQETVLRQGTPEEIFMELKRTNGFDVVKGGISYESFLKQHQQMREYLSRHLPDGAALQSVYEVGCGSGANLFLLEQDGITCGGVDYSPRLLSYSKQVLHTADLRCADALEFPQEPQLDAVISVSVFGYFINERYAETVLEKMLQKARYSLGILEVADAAKADAYTAYRRELIPNYDERYKDLPRQFYCTAFFEEFAQKHGLGIEIVPMTIKDYWNSRFYFDCYLYKC